MVFLLFAILFGLAAAYGYYLDKQNEDFQNRWICTGRSALAGSSFAMLFCFVLWIIFKQAEAGFGKRNGEASLPAIDPEARIELSEGEDVPSPTLPRDTIFKLRTRYTVASLSDISPDSTVWLRQHLRDKVCYRIAASRGKQTAVLVLPEEQVTFVSGSKGEVIEQGFWSVHKMPWGSNRLMKDSVHYLVTPPSNVAWWDFKGVDSTD